jgi:DNA-binding transcriptional MerR regulator
MRRPRPAIGLILPSRKGEAMTNFDDPPVESRGGLVGDPADGCAQNVSETILSLENVAQMFSISRLILLYYEFRGLIKRRHRIGNIAVYGWADCDRIAFIIKCRRAGVPLKHVAPIIAAVDHEDDVEIHRLGQQACMELVTSMQEQRKIINEALAEIAHTYSLLSTKLRDPDIARNQR